MGKEIKEGKKRQGWRDGWTNVTAGKRKSERKTESEKVTHQKIPAYIA
jgi:hypothetical protein